ncbi:MAG TPA: T9SS type A sorting domain-containing protein [Ignavibacteria bacterium]|nr:T9SS type A sorting domain-containing protein [Ignavibacteria bacterium]HMR41240.1 T9SS type A sorting domain-containing protein [Ignavibacteria bacterium]
MKNFKTLFSIVFLSIFLSTNISYSDPSSTFAWVEQISGTTQTLTSVHSSSGQVVWACGYGGTVIRSSNYGAVWNNVSGNGIPSGAQLINIVSKGSGDIALAAGYIGSNTFVYRTFDAGANWTQVFTEPNGFINALYSDISNNNMFMTGDPVGGRWSLWRSTDAGFTWDSSGMYLPQTGAEAGWNNSLFGNGNQLWFGTNNTKVYYSSNFGSSWIAQPTTGEVNSYSVWFCRIGLPDQATGFIGGSTLQKSTNSGSNWIPQTSAGAGNFGGISGGPNIILDDPTGYLLRFYIRSNIIYSSENNGTVWIQDYTAPSGNYRYIGSDYSGLRCWAVRDNGGISYLDLPVGISQTNSFIPTDFSLNQNYPNPFNPVTQIEFSVPVQGFVSLKVYDANGREVKTLVNENKSAGNYKVDFSAISEGSSLSSGIYFYTLISGSYRETKSMIILK